MTVMDMRKEAKQRAEIFCWMRSSLWASVDLMQFQTTDAYLRFNKLEQYLYVGS
jgi:hypothetical protein